MEKNLLLLSFNDKSLEKEFKRFYEQESRIYVRIGIILSLLGWASLAIVSYFVAPQKMGMLLPIILGSTFPAFIFILYSTYKDSFIGHYQWMATAANGIAGSLQYHAETRRDNHSRKPSGTGNDIHDHLAYQIGGILILKYTFYSCVFSSTRPPRYLPRNSSIAL